MAIPPNLKNGMENLRLLTTDAHVTRIIHLPEPAQVLTLGQMDETDDIHRKRESLKITHPHASIQQRNHLKRSNEAEYKINCVQGWALKYSLAYHQRYKYPKTSNRSQH